MRIACGVLSQPGIHAHLRLRCRVQCESGTFHGSAAGYAAIDSRTQFSSRRDGGNDDSFSRTRQLGLELGSILLIFTGQAWNMTFSFYSSLKNIPAEMREVARVYRWSWWQRFVQMEMPFATIGLVWNSMMSVAGGWFFPDGLRNVRAWRSRSTSSPGTGFLPANRGECRRHTRDSFGASW